jgi:pectin methylesterase-like acyl-CoA thioesterase
MTLRYPTDMLTVPADRWDARTEGVISSEDDEGNTHALLNWSVPAATQEEAERRVLSVQHHDYEDDLEGARAEGTLQGDRWFVTIIMKPYR